MGLSVLRGKELITEFCGAYPAAYSVQYRVKETQEELYGPGATREAIGKIFGGFLPGDGKLRRGRCDFATSAFRDESDFERALRHELIGHFGINTFKAEEKLAVLTSIVEARDQPALSKLWANVDRHYDGLSELRKAEEVYAFACESINPRQKINKAAGERSFREVCVNRSRPLQLRDLADITEMVAAGMQDRTRSQQIFPATGYEQFRKETDQEIAQTNHTGLRAAAPQRSTLDPIGNKMIALEFASVRDKLGGEGVGTILRAMPHTQYAGKIIQVSDTHIVQKIGAHLAVAHDVTKLANGAQLVRLANACALDRNAYEFHYSGDHGTVMKLHERELRVHQSVRQPISHTLTPAIKR